jgi:signal transduction histidine kinase
MIHEIRNPLEALSNLTYLIRLSVDDPDRVREYCNLAEEQMETVNRIANQTLGFARQIRTPREVNLGGVADAALRIHQRTIATKRVRLVKEIQEDVTAEVYTSEILQVISNVIMNALDALPDEGTLSLRLRRRNGEIQFVIADNGHGIAKDHVANIFQPFFTTKEGQGTGLGLALSKNIVDRHRGKIRLRSSVRPGRSGTTFRISIPAVAG